jgi:threonine/homoserine efflux transporter RhtA
MEKNIEPALALIVGILILIQPALLGLIVAVYLIVIGILGLARNLRT